MNFLKVWFNRLLMEVSFKNDAVTCALVGRKVLALCRTVL